MDNLPVDPSTAQKTPDLPSPFLHPTSSAQPLPSAVHPAPADLTLPSTSSETANILSSSQPASFGSSPPLPPLPPQEQRISLSESLAQLQGEAAFVPRPPQPPAQPQAVAGGVLAEPGQPKRAIDESVEFYISGLTARELFVRLPEHDPVSALLEQYLQPQNRPQRDLSGNWEGQTLDTLIANRNWRGTARYSYNAITQCPPERTAYLLSHWLLRLHSLLRLRLIPQLASELTSILTLLPPSSSITSAAVPPAPDVPPFHPAVPFDFHILAASLPSLQGNKHRSVEALSALLKSVKEEMWEAKRAGRVEEGAKWRGRAERVGAMLVELLTEMKASSSASSLLASSSPSLTLHRHISHLHSSTGNLVAFSKHATDVTDERQKQEATVLSRVAQGQWKEAEAELRKLVEERSGDVEVINNLAVVLLYVGKLDEAITLLTDVVSTRPALAYHDETLLFNLSTLFELRTEQATSRKIGLLKTGAEYGAQGVEAGAFKLAL